MSTQPNTRESFTFDLNFIRSHFGNFEALGMQQLTHNRYRGNPVCIADHVISCLSLDGTERLLDLGCGNGHILREVATRMRYPGSLVGFDISPAMLAEAESTASRTWVPIDFHEGTALDLGRFHDAEFDRVMMNFLFQYVGDYQTVCAEVKRVLKPNSVAVVSAEGSASMIEMYERHFQAMEICGFPADLRKMPDRGNLPLELAEERLAGEFKSVELRPYPDSLVFQEITPYMEFYIRGMRYCGVRIHAQNRPEVTEEHFTELEREVRALGETELRKTGAIKISKEIGTVVCWN